MRKKIKQSFHNNEHVEESGENREVKMLTSPLMKKFNIYLPKHEYLIKLKITFIY